MGFSHIPVMPEKTIEALKIDPDGIYIDGTVGGAGHASLIAQRLSHGMLLAFDRDTDAVEAAGKRLGIYDNASVKHSDFRDIPDICADMGINAVDGILLDLGVSSHQIDTPERGFSYMKDGPLDMRMDRDCRVSAADIVNDGDETYIAGILRDYGEERFAARIAAEIVRARSHKRIETTNELADIVRTVIPAAARREGGNPCKRTFQALRIAVNGELDAVSEAVETLFGLLRSGGRFVIITFHSLEDRIVKRKFLELCTGCTCPPDFPVCVCGKTAKAIPVTRKPLTADEEEIKVNPRAKSAKLRVIERL